MKILVTYATAAGSTGEVAEAVAKALREGGTTVDVRRAKGTTDLSGYDAVVLGSGVRAGRTYAEAGQFLATHQSALQQMPVAGFVVCLAARDSAVTDVDVPGCPEAEGYLDAMFAQAGVEPVSKGLFAGSVDYAKLPRLLGWILKGLKKEPGGDYRDWAAIEAWASRLAQALAAG
jgi:menaquinone-dependent protoporphyrinogen oxidase